MAMRLKEREAQNSHLEKSKLGQAWHIHISDPGLWILHIYIIDISQYTPYFGNLCGSTIFFVLIYWNWITSSQFPVFKTQQVEMSDCSCHLSRKLTGTLKSQIRCWPGALLILGFYHEWVRKLPWLLVPARLVLEAVTENKVQPYLTTLTKSAQITNRLLYVGTALHLWSTEPLLQLKSMRRLHSAVLFTIAKLW